MQKTSIADMWGPHAPLRQRYAAHQLLVSGTFPHHERRMPSGTQDPVLRTVWNPAKTWNRCPVLRLMTLWTARRQGPFVKLGAAAGVLFPPYGSAKMRSKLRETAYRHPHTPEQRPCISGCAEPTGFWRRSAGRSPFYGDVLLLICGCHSCHDSSTCRSVGGAAAADVVDRAS